MVKIPQPGAAKELEFPPNQPDFMTGQLTVPVLGKPKNLPSIDIPDGFSLVVKAMKGNSGTISIANSPGSAVAAGTSGFTLAANDEVELFVKNAEIVYIDATVVGDGIEYVVEQAE